MCRTPACLSPPASPTRSPGLPATPTQPPCWPTRSPAQSFTRDEVPNMRWRILKERATPKSLRVEGDLATHSEFARTRATFEGTAEEVGAHVEALRVKTGICHSAELIQ